MGVGVDREEAKGGAVEGGQHGRRLSERSVVVKAKDALVWDGWCGRARECVWCACARVCKVYLYLYHNLCSPSA